MPCSRLLLSTLASLAVAACSGSEADSGPVTVSVLPEGVFRPSDAGLTVHGLGLAATLDRDGLHLSDRLSLRTRSWGRDDGAIALAAAAPTVRDCASAAVVPRADGVCTTAAVYDHGGLSEWWTADGGDLAQGFVVTALPEGDGRLHVELDVEGAEIRLRGGVAFLVPPQGEPLRYGDLRAWDAEGRSLDATLTPTSRGLRLSVDVEQAALPIVIDPIVTEEAWYYAPGQSGADMGAAVADAGDINGDGYADVIIGSPYYDDGHTNEGAAYVFLGTASGLSTSPHWEVQSGISNGQIGFAVAGAGDVDGDGYDDVLVGQPSRRWGANDYVGRALLYLGSASGLSTTEDWSVQGSVAYEWVGWSVVGAGDLNGDGYADIAVGAPGYTNGETWEGAAYVFYGSATGPASSPDLIIESDTTYARAGRALGAGGDLDNDGYDDLVVGWPWYTDAWTNQGHLEVFLGGASGVDPTPVFTATGSGNNEQLGESLSIVQDVDGDGFDELLYGGSGHQDRYNQEGKAWLHYGTTSGPESTASWTVTGGATSLYLGASVSGAGDINGDTYGDLVIGVYNASDSWTNEGAVEVYFGSASGPPSSPDFEIYGDLAGAHLGYPVAIVGDIDGDGQSDILAGAPDANPGGEARLYTGLGAVPGVSLDPDWTDDSDEVQAFYGAALDGAGDVNGDGYDDVILGAYGYDDGQTDEGAAFVIHGNATGLDSGPNWAIESNQANAWLGYEAAGAGDVNGDGYADVIVGAPKWSNGQSAEGGAWVYHGSVTGVETTSSWSDESDQVGANFGWSVASAGDVDGNGADDVIVGAYLASNGQTNEGLAHIYLGSGAGLASTPAWTGESNLYKASFGYDVAGMGDVNGDGYDDVIVGDPNYGWASHQRGYAFGYHGGAGGPDTTADWAVAGQSGAEFGWAVAGAGDVNGDGYDDAIVGGPDYDGAFHAEGRALVFHGSSSGLSTSADTEILGQQDYIEVGYDVAGAGDVNGDGYADVVVGAYKYTDGERNEGAAFLYLGSASGIDADRRSWQDESDQAWANFGRGVAGAGDVNADGLFDLIIAAPSYYNGESEEGQAYLYLGQSTERTFYVDADGDGYGDSSAGTTTGPGSILPGYAYEDGDCDDADPSIRPDIPERCDGGSVDENCDGLVDDDDPYLDASTATAYYVDADGDGYGAGAAVYFCTLPSGYSAVDTDCDDTDAAVNPGATDVAASGTDADCDGSVECYEDADGDSWRTATLVTRSASAGGTGLCTGGGYAPASMSNTDCDDTDAAIHPGATEICDAADTDEDCDGLADDDDSSVSSASQTTLYPDTDGDGYGDPSGTLWCDAPSGWVADDSDCVDSDAGIHPGATDADADGTDSDCDGSEACYADADADGYRTDVLATHAVTAGATGQCSVSGRAAATVTATDCDDTDAAVNPGETEVCDAADTDEDCNGVADDADSGVDPSTRTTAWRDGDGDGFGAGASADFCDLPSDHVANGDDCDDSDASVRPAALETPGDGVDSDCDGIDVCFADADDDGYRSADGATVDGTGVTCTGPGEGTDTDATGDCDDTDATVNPGATEVAGDEVDSDCDGRELCLVDGDGDGYVDDPSATTVSADLDCADAGEARAGADTGDCDDTRSDVYPGAPEPDCDDPVDYNCDGSTGQDDADADGWVACEDCDDTDGDVHPDAPEECNGVDDNCDGLVDEGCGGDDTGPGSSGDSGEDDDDDDDDDGGKFGCSAAPQTPGLTVALLALLGLGRRARRRLTATG
jgi:hypothetical protein